MKKEIKNIYKKIKNKRRKKKEKNTKGAEPCRITSAFDIDNDPGISYDNATASPEEHLKRNQTTAQEI